MSYNELTLSGLVKSNSSRVTVTSATIAVCYVWTVAAISLGVRAIIRVRPVIIWRFWSVRVVLWLCPFRLRRCFFLIQFFPLEWPTEFYCMARFFAVCAQPCKILFHLRIVWIIGCIDLMILYQNADFFQRFLNIRKTWVSGYRIGTWLLKTRHYSAIYDTCVFVYY